MRIGNHRNDIDFKKMRLGMRGRSLRKAMRILLPATILVLAGCGHRTQLGTTHPAGHSTGAEPSGISPGWSLPGQDGICAEGSGPCGKGTGVRCNDLQNDPENCGACGNVCTLGIRCATGTCQQVKCSGALSLVPGAKMDPGPGAGPAVVADMNGDGHLDILTSNFNPGVLGIRLGTGDGSFGPGTIYQPDGHPMDLVIGDFNEDGLPDLALTSTLNTNNPIADVTIWLGDGTGAIAKSAQIGFRILTNRLVAGDVNNDGHLDIIVIAAGVDITVLLGKGDGTMTKAGEYSTGEQPFDILIRDWNSDGNPDLIAFGSTLHVLLGKGDGTFGTQQDCAIAVAQDDVVADFNRDGKYDIATILYGSEEVSVLLGLGECRFSTATKYSVSPHPQPLSSGDLNGDGIFDLVVMTEAGRILVLTGKGDGTFAAEPEMESLTSDVYSNLIVGDVNGDGRADIIVSGAKGVQVFINTCP
jgi:hypothetical protein